MEEKFEFKSRRSAVICQNGCAASSNALASQIGLDVLKEGGNAADAAVAVAAALGVLEPSSTGIGGDAFCLFYDAASKTLKGINGSGRASSRATLAAIQADGFTAGNRFSPQHGHSVTVPGAACAWVDTVETFGNHELPLSRILQPSIDLARKGFPVYEISAHGWAKGADVLQREENLHGKSLLLSGEPPKAGQIMVNPDLARTYEELATHGKKGFYEGRIAQVISAVVQQHGGLLTESDLSSHTSTPAEPICVDHRGVRVWELPPNGQGITALIALNILEGFDLKSMGHNSGQYLHHVTESLRLAFADTLVYCADPAHADIPIEQLLSKEYAAKRRALIKPDARIPSSSLSTSGLDLPLTSDTVYFTTSDRWGNACSFINSVFWGFGSGLVPEGCGFSLQNRGFGFSLDPNNKNVIAPGKRPYHTIIPAMVTSADTGDLLMSYGVMGGYMQPQGHVQVLLNMLLFGRSPQGALDVPRISLGAPNVHVSHNPHSMLDSLQLEEGISPEALAELASLGHDPHIVSGHGRAVFGRGQVISQGSWWRSGLEDRDTDVYWAGSDPRGDGLVAGY
ncbi:glutathione hydrolase-like YwrD proenzyme [Aplysia californica]|uniref:Glutathione hydrolase-like YwrD proenzyme n=1 Tax=Aplysia californica TaxID=6500 RepID=A0ABM0JE39_APLCA|nr:glutathione hydrolase-like YwrD proenzyme [Aplysia californica]